MSWKRYIWVLVWAVLLADVLSAAMPYKPSPGLPESEAWRWQLFTHPYLAGVDTHCSFRSSDGSIWFGTWRGIVRYDGTQWEKFGKEHGIYDQAPRGFFESVDGTVYYCTSDAIYHLKEKKWVAVYKALSGRQWKIQDVVLGGDGGFWMATGAGMMHFKNGTRTLWVTEFEGEVGDYSSLVERIGLIESGQVFSLGRKKTTFLRKNQMPDRKFSGAFKQVSEGPDGKIWGLTSKGTLYSVKPSVTGGLAGWKCVSQSASGINMPKNVKQLFAAKDGSVWGVGDDSLSHIVRYDPVRNEIRNVPVDPKINVFGSYSSITQSGDGTIWIGVGSGLLVYSDNKWRSINSQKLPGARVAITDLATTSDDSLWVFLGRRGVVRLDLSSDKWLTYRGLHFHGQEKNGTQWFISSDKRVVRNENGKWSSFGVHDGLMEDPTSVFVSNSGQVWATGRQGKAASVAWFEGGHWYRRLHGDFAGDIDPDSIFEDRAGSVWFGSRRGSGSGTGQKGGVLCYPLGLPWAGRKFHYFKNPRGSQVNAAGVAQDVNGRLLVGGQLKRLKGGKLQFYDLDGLDRKIKVHLAQSPDGVWILDAKKRLFHLKDGDLESYEKPAPFIEDKNICLLAGDDGGLWMGSEQGICRFRDGDWSQQVLHADLATSGNIQALRRGKKNSFWINLNPQIHQSKGAYDPNEFRTTRYTKPAGAPDTRIEHAPEDGRHHQADTLFLSWGGIDQWGHTPSEQLYYSYRLDEGPWSEFSAEKQSVFKNLSVGRHLFEVRARDLDLNIDPIPATLSFDVLGPIWGTPWFLSFLGVVFGITAFLVIGMVRLHELRLTERLEFEKEQAEHKRELDRSRLEFLTNISHEFRTPLTLILGPLEKLFDGVGSSYLQEQARIAQRNANRLLNLVNQLLDMRKLQERRVTLDVTEGDVVEFVYSLLETFYSMAAPKSITLLFESTIESRTAQFDPDKLEKIVTNLVSNAVKFTPDNGEVRVTIDADNIMVSIRVEDTGPGIEPEFQEVIFKRFEQAPSDETGHRGTGIGLALTKELVELHGGCVFVTSPINPEKPEAKGSAFTVRFPVSQDVQISGGADEEIPADADASAEGESAEEITVPESTGVPEKQTVLVIEDNPDMRRFIRLELDHEYAVMEAEDGRQGFRMAKEFMPDLIVSDVMMPHMTGLEVCTALKANVLTSHIPLILLTARGSHEAQIEGLETGADDYIVKPFSSAVLKVRIKNLLEQRRKLHERFSGAEELNPRVGGISARDSEFLEKAIRTVEEHIDDVDFDSDLFAQKVGISRSKLYRKLKALTGQSVNVFVRTIRLKRAMKMLASGEYTVGEVSFEVGFVSHSYFTKCFTKEFGRSPSECIRAE